MFFFEMNPSYEFGFNDFVIYFFIIMIINYGYLYFLYIHLTPIENLFNDNDDTKNQIQTTKQIPLFSPDLYLKKYKSMEKSNLTDLEMKNLCNSFIIEKTPLGNVLLYYDTNENSFHYLIKNSLQNV